MPGKAIFSIKAPNGRLKTRAVVCGNALDTISSGAVYSAGVEIGTIRSLLKWWGAQGAVAPQTDVSSEKWCCGVTDIGTAFLNADALLRKYFLTFK